MGSPFPACAFEISLQTKGEDTILLPWPPPEKRLEALQRVKLAGMLW